jgi:hypothetical protein
MPNERTDYRAVHLVVKNGTKLPSRLVLKGFSGFYDLAAGESYEVRARGPATGTLTVEQVEGGSIVAGWPGCILSVHMLRRLGGQQLKPLGRADAPTVALLRRMSTLRGYGGADDDDDETLV